MQHTDYQKLTVADRELLLLCLLGYPFLRSARFVNDGRLRRSKRHCIVVSLGGTKDLARNQSLRQLRRLGFFQVLQLLY